MKDNTWIYVTIIGAVIILFSTVKVFDRLEFKSKTDRYTTCLQVCGCSSTAIECIKICGEQNR